jgi:hypothetical protein
MRWRRPRCFRVRLSRKSVLPGGLRPSRDGPELHREQSFLMPPDVRESLPENHLAWFLLGAVEEIDLEGFYAAQRLDPARSGMSVDQLSGVFRSSRRR